jgi:hypothetical protein
MDYRLWPRFEDGWDGGLFLGNLLKIEVFGEWRGIAQFCGGVVDPAAATVVWKGGIRLDPDVLYQNLIVSASGKEFRSPRLASAVE